VLTMAKENLDRAIEGLIGGDVSQRKNVDGCEDEIDFITGALASFFIKLMSTPISGKDKALIGRLHHVINDIERIGDHATMIAKETKYMKMNGLVFQDELKAEIEGIYDRVSALYQLCLSAFESRSTAKLKAIGAAQREIRDLVRAVGDEHIRRLSADMYPVEISKSVYVVLNTFQRVSAHLVNIAFSIVSDTGSKKEAFAYLEKIKKSR